MGDKDKKSKRHGRLVRALTETLEMDVDGLLGEPEITITSDRRIVVSGVKSVLEYENGSVRVLCRDFTLSVSGSDFSLNTFDGDSLSITGSVTRIEIE